MSKVNTALSQSAGQNGQLLLGFLVIISEGLDVFWRRPSEGFSDKATRRFSNAESLVFVMTSSLATNQTAHALDMTKDPVPLCFEAGQVAPCLRVFLYHAANDFVFFFFAHKSILEQKAPGKAHRLDPKYLVRSDLKGG